MRYLERFVVPIQTASANTSAATFRKRAVVRNVNGDNATRSACVTFG